MLSYAPAYASFQPRLPTRNCLNPSCAFTHSTVSIWHLPCTASQVVSSISHSGSLR